ncbi:MAG: nitroreductase family deazaflavin-dependent oxidoreductase [Chloroflexi bacterium]|nr:nitroreductase family deazaflavin-dependent oxidoreductase [Chloroflexota bacterium]
MWMAAGATSSRAGSSVGFVNPLLMRLGLVPTLAVRGRRSGRWHMVPVNVLELDGARYLVAPRGEADWVRNLRAVGTGELRRGSRVKAFRAVEVPGEEKPRLIEAYLERWGHQVRSQFQALPNPSAHPVFRIDSPETKAKLIGKWTIIARAGTGTGWLAGQSPRRA